MNKKDLPATKEDISLLKGDIARLEAKSATKDDISLLKGDIARLEAKSATKDDISLLKGDISALKTELESRIDAVDARLDAKIDSSTKRLAMEISRTNGRIDDLKESLTQTMHQQSDRILTALDRSTKLIEANNRAVVLHGSILTEVQIQLQDHDQRITRLEHPPAP